MRGVIVVAAASLAACTVGQKKGAIERTLSADETRRESFEATLRTLDENPAYVDEFFSMVQRHPATLRRFLGNHAHTLHEPWLAEMTAEALVTAPPGLQRIMEQTLLEARDPAARAAIARAMAAQAPLAAGIVAEHPEAGAALLQALGRVQSQTLREALRRMLPGAGQEEGAGAR